MALTDDRTTLNDMDIGTDIDQWTSPDFDAITLNDTNQPTRLYREGDGCGQMIIKGNTDSYWYDDVTFDLTGGIRGDKLLVMWLQFFAPSVGFMADMLVGMYDATGGQGGAGNGGRWDQRDDIIEADQYGWWPAAIYPTQPDETSGTFSSMAKASMDSIELDVNNNSGNDVKLAGMEAVFILSYIGAHSQTVTFENLVDHSKDKTNDRDFGVAFQKADVFRYRVSLRIGDAAATAATIHSDSDKTVQFDNVNSDHEIGYDFINDTGGDTITFGVSGNSYIWNGGAKYSQSELWTGENNVDTWTPANCTWRNGGGGAALPTHVTGKTTNGHTFDNCGPINMKDGVIEGATFKNAPGAGALYSGTGTRRAKNNLYQDSAVGIEIDTAQTLTLDGDKFSGNTYDIENSANATAADSYSETNQNATQTVGNGTTTAAGQGVTGNGGVLSSMRFHLSKTGTPTGNAVAKLYAHTGTFGTSGTPTGTVLATSLPVDVSALTGTLTLTNFYFTDEFTLVNATKYFAVIEYSGGDVSNYVNAGVDTTSPTHGGNWATFAGSWSAVAGTDGVFYLNTGAIVTVNSSNGANPSTFTATGTQPGTVIIVNAVDLRTTYSNRVGDLLPGVNVRYEKSDGTLIAQGTTNASGVYLFSINVSELPITGARIDARRGDFEDFFQGVSIPVTGFDIPVTLAADLDVDRPI